MATVRNADGSAMSQTLNRETSRSTTDRSTTEWIFACRAADLADGDALRVDVVPPVAVFNVAGEFFATDDTCTHAEFSLSEGYTDGDEVECVLHRARFSLRTGEALTLPATVALRTYPTELRDGDVYVRHGHNGCGEAAAHGCQAMRSDAGRCAEAPLAVRTTQVAP